jgi:hypothetical protein
MRPPPRPASTPYSQNERVELRCPAVAPRSQGQLGKRHPEERPQVEIRCERSYARNVN